MGLLSTLLGKPSGQATIESQLEAVYVPMFQQMGMPAAEAKRTVAEMIGRIKENYVKECYANRSPNNGDGLLEQEKTDTNIKIALDKKRAEGVKDTDIRWWWNLHYFERAMMVEVDDLNWKAGFIALLRQGLMPEQAAERMRQGHVIYGDPANQKQGIGEDRALPIELKDRINCYLQRRMQSDPRDVRPQRRRGADAHTPGAVRLSSHPFPGRGRRTRGRLPPGLFLQLAPKRGGLRAHTHQVASPFDKSGPHSDEQGWCTLTSLIPGATYQFGHKEIETTFRAKAGEMLKLPDVVMKTRP